MSYVAVSPGDAPPKGLAGLGALSLMTPVTIVKAPSVTFPRPSMPIVRTPVVSTPGPGKVEVPPPAAPPTPEDVAFAKAFVDKLIAAASKGQFDEEPADLQKLLSLTRDQLKSLVEQLEKLGKAGSAVARAAFDLTVAELAATKGSSKTPMIVAGVAALAVAAFLFMRRKKS
jgi:LPXTG-motif cell wall-anchored protein